MTHGSSVHSKSWGVRDARFGSIPEGNLQAARALFDETRGSQRTQVNADGTPEDRRCQLPWRKFVPAEWGVKLGQEGAEFGEFVGVSPVPGPYASFFAGDELGVDEDFEVMADRGL